MSKGVGLFWQLEEIKKKEASCEKEERIKKGERQEAIRKKRRKKKVKGYSKRKVFFYLGLETT